MNNQERNPDFFSKILILDENCWDNLKDNPIVRLTGVNNV